MIWPTLSPTCPDCKAHRLRSAAYGPFDGHADGFCMTCPSCGFQVAGRNEAKVRAACNVLAAWASGPKPETAQLGRK